MIKESAVTALNGLVGFRQPINTDIITVDADNLTSDSGIRFEDATGLVTIENILDTYEYDILTDGQKNTVLKNLKQSAARDVLNMIFGDKSVNLESNTLFPYEEDFRTTYTLSDDFYYIEFEPDRNKRIVISLDNIWLSLDSAVTFNIYVYHSKKLDPVKTQEITTVAGEATKVNLSYVLEDTGTYRIGYKSADLGTAKPYKRDFERSNVVMLSEYAQMEFGSVNFVNNRLDVENYNSLEDGYGMNLEYSVYMDWTHEITKNKDKFARAIQLQMALTSADRMLTTTQSNITQRLTQEALNRIAYVVGNDSRGLKGQFNKELSAIKNFFFPDEKIITKTLR